MEPCPECRTEFDPGCRLCRYRRGYLDYYAKNSEAIRERARAWRKKNSAKVAAQVVERKAKKLKATPTWANRRKIREFYEEAAFATEFFAVDFHVDHIVPLVSELVCGLHCEANLQVIRADANRAKSNYFWPDMP